MPYPRYSGGGGNNYNSGGGRRDNYGAGNRGYGPNPGGMVSPWQGGNPGGLLPTPSGGGGGNLALALGSLLNSGTGSGGNVANLASQLNLAQALAGSVSGGGGGGGGPTAGANFYGGAAGGNYGGGMRRDSRFRHDNSPPRRGYRSRSRSPPRRSRYDEGRGGGSRPHKRNRDSSPTKERPEHEIYIGNYPVKFREDDIRSLFVEHKITVKSIRMKHDGLKVFAFAETESKEEIAKAVEAMDSMEINGRRLRVRSAGDKEPRGPNPKYVRRELNVNDVKKHLVYAFNGFLERETSAEGLNETKVEEMKTVQTMLKSIFDLPDDDSLKISRDLEVIFMQNNRREIKVPEPEKTGQKDGENGEGNEASKEGAEEIQKEGDEPSEEGAQKCDDGNWKRRKVSKENEGEEEEVEEEDEEGGEQQEMEEDQDVTNEEDEGQEDTKNSNEKAEAGEQEEEEDVVQEGEEAASADASVEGQGEGDDDDDVSSAIAESTDELEAESFPPSAAKTSPQKGGGRGRGRGSGRARRARGRKN